MLGFLKITVTWMFESLHRGEGQNNKFFLLSFCYSGSEVCPNSSDSSSTTQNKERSGVQMGPRYSRRQTPHADLRNRPQHVGVAPFPSVEAHSISDSELQCKPIFKTG